MDVATLGDVMKNNEKKQGKKIKELFVKDLARIEGGSGAATRKGPEGPDCPDFTTLACGEEPPECSGC